MGSDGWTWVQVETFGSMDKREKVELILEQMRLCLAKKDYVRTQIISKKIAPKFFDDPEQQVGEGPRRDGRPVTKFLFCPYNWIDKLAIVRL